VTEIAQTHSELDALMARVKEQVAACELTEAILVDDKLETDPSESQWIQAVAKLRTDDAPTFEKLGKLYQEAGQERIEDLPIDAIWDKAVGIVNASTAPAVTSILNKVEYKEPALKNLVELLKEVGIGAICRTRVTDEDPPSDRKLYFLDYRMEGNDQTAGMHATQLLRRLVQREGDSPPAAVLMSRGQDEHPTSAEWEKVAKDAGYFRFNFRYLNKAKVDSGKMAFYFFLHELLESYPLGKEYYAQLQGLRKAAKLAADAALANIRQLNPVEFSIYAGKFLGDDTGRKASRHVLNLFLGLLDAEVKNNETLEASFRTFADMLMKTPMLATKDKDTHKLHELHTRLLYDRSKWVLSGPIVFGDMYKKLIEPDVYYLVITPECDLDPRFKDGVWLPKADQLLLIRGRVTNQPTEKHPENYVGMPFVSEKHTLWIRWQLREALFVASQALVSKTPPATPESDPNGYVRWGRLRNTEAEHVQQEYASDLVEVGVDDISGLTQPRMIEFWHVQSGRPDNQLEALVIVETANLKDDKNPNWAFGEGCELLLCPDTPSEVFFSFSDLVKLRKPTVRKDFLDECKKKNLQFIETEGEPSRFVRSKQSFKGGKEGWKPKRPATAQPPSGDQPSGTPQQDPRAKGEGGQEGGKVLSEGTEKLEVKLTDEGPGLPTEERK
jgi:hypothetical protein